MRILVAMSGGVDSSVAAALLRDEGHEVVGVTMRLWGGPSDTGCCSAADVDDARRVAQQLDLPHFVFDYADEFARHVVDPYVADHRAGRTPNPCIECNRHLKFDRLLDHAYELGYDAVATGHHVRVAERDGRPLLRRAVDLDKDQSYVLHVLDPEVLGRCRFPIGDLTKADVRALAAELGLRTAAKPESQDVCFISRAHGRRAFLGDRIPLRPGRLVDTEGRDVGEVDAIELVTVGQRRGLRLAGAAERRFAIDVDVEAGTVVVGGTDDLLVTETPVPDLVVHTAARDELTAQTSAHGRPAPVELVDGGVRWPAPHTRVAPGQAVVLYDGDLVVGGGTAGR
ncbi:MAG: tRNA 2-thiouridine(34) synthase MnmA [Actinomycetota bacterium]